MKEMMYRQHGEYLLPDMGLTAEEQQPLGKYGRMRLKYLKEERPILYNCLLMSGRLTHHLHETDLTARTRLERMMQAGAKAAGVTENLKAADPMRWTQEMNNLKAQAEEVLMTELIYS